MLTETYAVKQGKAKELYERTNSLIWYLKEKQEECKQKERELNLPIPLAIQRDWDFTKTQRILLNGARKITLGAFFSIKEVNQFTNILEIYNSEDFFEEAR